MVWTGLVNVLSGWLCACQAAQYSTRRFNFVLSARPRIRTAHHCITTRSSKESTTKDPFSPMPSTTLSSSSASRFQSILDNALRDYTKQTGVDLVKYDFVNQLEGCRSPDEVTLLLREKARKFKEYREGNRKLINWVTPIVQVVHVFSGFLGEASSMVSRRAFISSDDCFNL